MTDINEKILKIWGSSCIEPSTELKLGDEVELKVQGAIVQVIDSDNNDGTKDISYVVKQKIADIKVINQNEDKQSDSKKQILLTKTIE